MASVDSRDAQVGALVHSAVIIADSAAAPTHPPTHTKDTVNPESIIAQQEQRICAVPEPPDPFPLKAIPSTVLTEEDYVDTIDRIIERDYFPDLERLRAESGLLDAQNTNNFDEAARLEAKLAGIVCTPMTHKSSPSTPIRECPLSPWGTKSEASVDGPVERPNFVKLPNGKWLRLNTDIRLDAFHARYTSEDNASFETLLAQDKAKRRAKEAWIEEKEKKHNERVAVTKALTDERGMVIPKELKHVEPMKVACTKHDARNMFHWKPVVTLDQGDKLQHRPAVRFKNTRFPTKMQNEDTLPEALKKRHELLAEQRKDEVYNAALFKGEFSNVSEEFVRTPNIVPTAGASPFMTYGKIASTPQLVDTLDNFQFKMQDPRQRDVTAYNLQRDTQAKNRKASRRMTSSRLRNLGITPENTPASASGLFTSGTRSIPASSPIGALLRKCKRAATMMARTPQGASTPARSIRSSMRTPALSSVGCHTPAVAGSTDGGRTPLRSDTSTRPAKRPRDESATSTDASPKTQRKSIKESEKP